MINTLNSEYLVASIVGPCLITIVTIFSQKIKDGILYLVNYITDLSVDELCFTIDGSYTRVFPNGTNMGADNYTKETGSSNKTMINAILHVLEKHKQQVVSNRYEIYNKNSCKQIISFDYSFNTDLDPGFGVSEEFVYYKDMKFLVNDSFSIQEKSHSYTKKIFIYKKKNGKTNKENIRYIKTFIQECVGAYIEFHKPKVDDRIYLYKIPSQNRNIGLNKNKYEIQTKKSFKTTFFPEKDLLIDMVDNVQNKKIDKLGILLFGQSGTGKTSVIKSISAYTRRSLIYIDLKAIKTEEELVNIFFQEDINLGSQYEMIKYNKRIYVIEDIDADSDIVLSRTSQEKRAESPTFIIQNQNQSESKSEKEKLSLKHLLQLFDGILELKDVIYIFTTNHIEKLDEALIRPGRINMKIHMTYMTTQCINEMVAHNFPDEKFEFGGKIEVTPSKLEYIILQSGGNFETFKETFDAFCKENPK